MIKNEGNKFFVEVFNPSHRWKYMGRIAYFKNIKVFVTHVKEPAKHFYIKGQGYPINNQLLCRLNELGIQYVVVPEDGKRGFTGYISPISALLNGRRVSEPNTEEQRVIPLVKMDILHHGYDEHIKKLGTC